MDITFQDIFKSSFIDHFDAIAPLDMVLGLILSFGLGLFIFFIYKKSYSGVLFVDFGDSPSGLAVGFGR